MARIVIVAVIVLAVVVSTISPIRTLVEPTDLCIQTISESQTNERALAFCNKIKEAAY